MFPFVKLKDRGPEYFDASPWHRAVVSAIANTLKLSPHISLEELFRDPEYKTLPDLPDYLAVSPSSFSPREILRIAAREFSLFITLLDRIGKSMLGTDQTININIFSLDKFVPHAQCTLRLPCLGYAGAPLSPDEVLRYKGQLYLEQGETAMKWLRTNAKRVASSPALPAPSNPTLVEEVEVDNMLKGWTVDIGAVNMNNEILQHAIATAPGREKALYNYLGQTKQASTNALNSSKFFDEIRAFWVSGDKKQAFPLQFKRAEVVNTATKYDTAASIYACAPCLSPKVSKEGLDWTELDTQYIESVDGKEKEAIIRNRLFYLKRTDMLHKINVKLTQIAREVAREKIKQELERINEHDAQLIAAIEERKTLIHNFNHVYRRMLETALQALLDLYEHPSERFVPTKTMREAFHARTRFHNNFVYMPAFLRPTMDLEGDINVLESCFFRDMEVSCTFVYNEAGTHYRRGVGITSFIKNLFFHKKWSLQSCSGSTGGGSELGRRVDKELQVWTRAVMTNKSPALVSKKIAKFCQETRLLIAEFKKRGWSPVSAQRLVGCYASGLATRCDLVLKDMENNLVLIEVKSGYADSFTREECKSDRDRMKAPFKTLAANPCRFAMIQLLLTWILHSTTYSNCKLDHSRVLVAHITDRVQFYTIPPKWALEVQARLKQEMKRRNELFKLKTGAVKKKTLKRKRASV